MSDTALDSLPQGIVREISRIREAGVRETLSYAGRNRIKALRERVLGPAGSSDNDPYASPWIPGGELTSQRGVLAFQGVFTSSQRLQDVFASMVSRYSGIRTYLEIGAADPVLYSNTYILEQHYGWRGVSVELDENLTNLHHVKRSNTCVNQDATETDYHELLASEGLIGDLGYLSLDVDPAMYSLMALVKIPLQNTRFACVTFEHDSYRSGHQVRDVSRKIFAHFGYRLAIKDVLNDGRPFEDWYIHPELLRETELEHLFASRIDPARHLRPGPQYPL